MNKDDIRAENAMLRLQLETLYQGSYYSKGSQEFDPETENMFLKNVIEFERQYACCRKITLAEKLGHPAWPTLGSAGFSKASVLLEQAVQFMSERGVDYLYGQDEDPVLVYLYLLNNLLSSEIDDVSNPDMRIVFFYEDDEEES